MFPLLCFINGASWFFLISFHTLYYWIMFTLCHFLPCKMEFCWEKKEKNKTKAQTTKPPQAPSCPCDSPRIWLQSSWGAQHFPLHRSSFGKLSFSCSNGTLLWEGGSELTSKILLCSGFTNRSLKHPQSLFIYGVNSRAMKELAVCCRFMEWEWAGFSSR